MKKWFIFVIAMSLLIVSGCGNQWKSYVKPVNKNDTITYSLGGNVNTDRLQKFIDNVDKDKKDRVNLIRYTDEGDPIIIHLYFNGENIEIAIDSSNDRFSGQDKNRIYYKTIDGGKQLNKNLLKYLNDNRFK